MSNVLVAYFSASGTTKAVAEAIADENGYDIFEIRPREIYTPEDLDWTDKNSRSTVEMNDRDFRPEIVETVDVSAYDTVAIGFPVWWYIAPSIIKTFIESVDLKGKTIKAFCTSGSSGIEKCVDDLSQTYPELDFADGMRFSGDVSSAKDWIEK